MVVGAVMMKVCVCANPTGVLALASALLFRRPPPLRLCQM